MKYRPSLLANDTLLARMFHVEHCSCTRCAPGFKLIEILSPQSMGTLSSVVGNMTPTQQREFGLLVRR